MMNIDPNMFHIPYMMHQRPEYHPKKMKYLNQILQEFPQFEIKKMLMLNQENITILHQVN